jgi:hypothetical protein
MDFDDFRESLIRAQSRYSTNHWRRRSLREAKIPLELFRESGYKLAPFFWCPSLTSQTRSQKMLPESRFASSYSEEMGLEDENATSQLQNRNRIVREIRAETLSRPRESKLDTISAAVVIGMTAQFVVFLFGLVTEFVPRLIENILLSVFVGLCVGVIGFALMKGND